MKRIIWLLVLIAAGYLAWKYYPEIERRAQQRQAGGPEPAPPEPPGVVAEAPSSPTPPATPAETFDPEVERRHPLPEFRPLEEVVDHWKNIPASAFPRQVTLRAPVTLSVAGGLGTARLEAGTQVVALSARGGILSIAPAIDSPVRGNVPLEQTDLKEVLGAIYESFQQKRREEVLTQRRAAQQELSRASAPVVEKEPDLIPRNLISDGPAPPAAAEARLGPKPPQNPDGTVPLMVASIRERQQAAAKAKRQSEPKLEDIRAWGPVRYQEIEGEPWWVGSVRYTAHTIFGEFPAEALALMRQGKVEKWIYAGTREPVY